MITSNCSTVYITCMLKGRTDGHRGPPKDNVTTYNFCIDRLVVSAVTYEGSFFYCFPIVSKLTWRLSDLDCSHDRRGSYYDVIRERIK